jgi:hypothetical protein
MFLTICGGVALFSLFRHEDGPPPGYELLRMGMTSNEVRAALKAEPEVEGDRETYFPERENIGGVVYVAYENGVVRSIGYLQRPTFHLGLLDWFNRPPPQTVPLPITMPAKD